MSGEAGLQRATHVAVVAGENGDASVAKRARLSVESSHRPFVDAPTNQQLQSKSHGGVGGSSKAVSGASAAQSSSPSSQSASASLMERRTAENGGTCPTVVPSVSQQKPPVVTARATGPVISLATANAQLINATLFVRLREHQLRCAKESGDSQAEATATAQLLGARALMGAGAFCVQQHQVLSLCLLQVKAHLALLSVVVFLFFLCVCVCVGVFVFQQPREQS